MFQSVGCGRVAGNDDDLHGTLLSAGHPLGCVFPVVAAQQEQCVFHCQFPQIVSLALLVVSSIGHIRLVGQVFEILVGKVWYSVGLLFSCLVVEPVLLEYPFQYGEPARAAVEHANGHVAQVLGIVCEVNIVDRTLVV